MVNVMSVTLNVLAADTDGASPCILLRVCKRIGAEEHGIQQILVNTCECITRALADDHIRYNTLDCILYTRVHPAYLSGLPSVLFGLSTFGSAECVISGPQGVSRYVDSVNTFFKRRYPEITVTEGSIAITSSISSDYKHFSTSPPPVSAPGEGFTMDPKRYLWALPSLKLSGAPARDNYAGVRVFGIPVARSQRGTKGWKDEGEIDLDDADADATNSVFQPKAEWMCYLITFRGPNDVVSAACDGDDATYIDAKQVLIIDCPGADNSCIQNTAMALRSQCVGKLFDDALIIHIGASAVVASHDYNRHIRGLFSAGMQQYDVVGQANDLDVMFHMQTESICRMHGRSSQLFPFAPTPAFAAREPSAHALTVGAKLMLFTGQLNVASSDASGAEKDGAVAPSVAAYTQPSTPRLCMLGTGAAAPSLRRSCSAIGFDAGTFGVLLDVGEGAVYRLRHLQRAKAWSCPFTRIYGVWISHMHADHHTGLLLLAWERVREAMAPQKSISCAPLLCCGPPQMSALISVYNQVINEAWGLWGSAEELCTRFPTGALQFVGTKHFNTQMNAVLPHGHSLQFHQFTVDHSCRDAYGLVLRHDTPEGVGLIAYSGDTRPCKALSDVFSAVLATTPADAITAAVVIHEATFDDDRLEDAIKKKHSTVSEAVAVSTAALKEIGKTPACVLLTHFSQRYPTFPSATTEKDGSSDAKSHVPVIFGFDGMCFDLLAPAFSLCVKEAEKLKTSMAEVCSEAVKE